jgi:hypothetical protein
MRPNTWAAVAAGAVLAVAGGFAIDGAMDRADAQAGFSVTPAQLQINQKISQAAVRRSNRSLNYLAPIRTQATDTADDGNGGVRPLSAIAGAGAGWTGAQIADGAIGTAELADGAVTAPKVAPAVSSGIARWAAIDAQGATASFFAQRGATAVTPIGPGVVDVTFDVPATQANCAAFATTEGNFTNYAVVEYVAGAVRVRTFSAADAPIVRDVNVSLFCN